MSHPPHITTLAAAGALVIAGIQPEPGEKETDFLHRGVELLIDQRDRARSNAADLEAEIAAARQAPQYTPPEIPTDEDGEHAVPDHLLLRMAAEILTAGAEHHAFNDRAKAAQIYAGTAALLTMAASDLESTNLLSVLPETGNPWAGEMAIAQAVLS